MLSLSLGLSAPNRTAGIPGFVVTLSPLTNGTATATVSAVPPGWTDIEWSVTGDPVFTLASMPTVDTSPDPVVVASATLSGGTWTITVTSPAHYAGTYTVTEAELAAGPHRLKAASVVEAPTGTYTATPGLWAFPDDDPPLFTYEWRAGSTVFGTADGVSPDGLSFTPTGAVESLITAEGIDFAETAANGAATTTQVVEVTQPVSLVAIRYSPSRVGGIRRTDALAGTRKYAAAFRIRLADNWSAAGAVYGVTSRLHFRIEANRSLFFEARAAGGTQYTNSDRTTAAGAFNTGQWYSCFIAADLDRGITGSRTWVVMRDRSVLLDCTTDASAFSNFFGDQSVPRNLGHSVATQNTETPINIFNGDIAPFVAFWRGTIPDPANTAIWDELFDPANGHAIRPEYLDGTKVTVGGLTPMTVLRGVNILDGVNSISSADVWKQFGTLQEAVFA